MLKIEKKQFRFFALYHSPKTTFILLLIIDKIMQPDKKHLIIIGGGFAGLQLARSLGNSAFHITLIDQQNHHQFQPLYYQVASARLEPSNISFPFRKVFQHEHSVEFRLAKVLSIEPQQNEITTSIGVMQYDYLVIATGCTTNFFGNKNIEANSLAMKTTEEAIEIRNHILLNFENIMAQGNTNDAAAMTIALVGAGPTGVELAGSFAEMKKKVLPRDYPNADFSALRIVLIEGSPNTLANMSPASQKASREYLEQLGVEVITGVTVTNYDGNLINLSNNTTIPCKNLVWAAGVTGNTIPGIPKENTIRNRYIVNRTNLLKDSNNIYALGDIAYMVTPKYPNAHPQVANVAINQAKLLAKNLLRNEKNKPLVEYEYNDLGSMATIGKHKAVVDLPFIHFQGRFAWFIWMFLHLMLILSVRNKLAIFFNWAWNYITNDNSLRLILRPRK